MSASESESDGAGGGSSDTLGGAFATRSSAIIVIGIVGMFIAAAVSVLAGELLPDVSLGIGTSIGLGGVTGAIGGLWDSIVGWVSFVLEEAPSGSTPVPVIDVAVPNIVLTVLGMTAAGFVVMDRLTGGFDGVGLPFVRDVADLSRAGLVFFFAWLVYIRADSMAELVYWLTITIPFAVIAVVAYTYFQQRREVAKRSTAARNTPDEAYERVADFGQIGANTVIATVVGIFAVIQVTFASIGSVGEVALSISSEFIYSVAIWIGYTSLGGDFGADLLPSFSAEQFVFAAAVLGGFALVLQRQGN